MQQQEWQQPVTEADVPAKFATWQAPGHPLGVEYSVAVLEQIRRISVDGYHRVPHGGVETGGILFGTHSGDLVRVLAWRPIGCKYEKGPSFVLSESDETALAASLADWPDDAEFGRLEPVGWYRAHTRSEVMLSAGDLAFFDRFFPQPWQVALIVRPASFAPTRAGFFFREAGGQIHADSSYAEFVLRVTLLDQMPPLPENGEAADLHNSPSMEAVQAAVQASEIPLLEKPHLAARHVAPHWIWYAAGAAILVLVVLAFWLTRPVHRDLNLSAADAGGQLRISWDGAAGWIGGAEGGSLEIDDHGVKTKVRLTPGDLRSGNLIYARQSSDVGVRMSVAVPGSAPVVSTTRFLRPAVTQPAVQRDVQQPESQPLPAPEQARLEPPRGPVPAPPVRRFRAPILAPKQSSTAMPNIAPPAIDSAPVVPPANLPSVLGAAPASPPPVAIPRPSTAASGRMMWTGRLGKNVRLVIERSHASTGNLTGVLPSVAARVTAYPGDLTAAGITLFTADPRYSTAITEKARAENGWNWTTYTWDPKRAGGIKILEQPGPQNNYRLVIESDMPKLSVVMLMWRATQ